MQRGRRSVAVDLKHPDGVATLLDLVERADALLEGFRPGVMERLGVGPDVCLARNPKLVYGRMTGWGQDGPYATAAGHDINYIALAGALAHIGRAGAAPVPPLNLVGDFGGGGMFLALGVVCALLEAQRSGQGQVVDAAMVDGTAVLMTMFWSLRHDRAVRRELAGHQPARLRRPLLRRVRVRRRRLDLDRLDRAAVLRRLLLDALDLADDPALAKQMDPAAWPALKERVAAAFRTRTRDEWCERLETTDVCFAPVLTMSEAAVAPAQRRPRHLRRGRRRHPARAGAALQPHAGRDRRPAVARRCPHARRVGRLGPARRAHRRPPRHGRRGLRPVRPATGWAPT